MRIAKGRTLRGGNEDDEDLSNFLESKKEVRLTIEERLAPYIIDPMNKYTIIYDITISVILLMAFVIDPYILSFRYEPLINIRMV